jgi:very-short-patch-repair endonuclease
MSVLEDIFWNQLRAVLPHDLPVKEHTFYAGRKWRFDFAWPDKKLAVEIDGGTWGKRGRHVTGIGFYRDCEKLNHAVIDGWHVLRGDSKMVKNGELLRYVELYRDRQLPHGDLA